MAARGGEWGRPRPPLMRACHLRLAQRGVGAVRDGARAPRRDRRRRPCARAAKAAAAAAAGGAPTPRPRGAPRGATAAGRGRAAGCGPACVGGEAERHPRAPPHMRRHAWWILWVGGGARPQDPPHGRSSCRRRRCAPTDTRRSRRWWSLTETRGACAADRTAEMGRKRRQRAGPGPRCGSTQCKPRDTLARCGAGWLTE